MDVFAHGLWTNAVFYKKYKTDWKTRLLSVSFGVLPDICSFTPIFIYGIFSRQSFFDLIGSNAWVVQYANESYNYTHSAVIFTVAALIVFAIRKRKFWWPMFGWALHISIDIFTHRNFYETPFLFPISNYRFSHGVSWAEPWFMALNYSVLIVVYIFMLYLWKKNKN